jgi:hypothetical protein
MLFRKSLMALFLISLAITSCKKNSSEDTTDDSDSTYSIASQALSEGSSHASATEGGSVANLVSGPLSENLLSLGTEVKNLDLDSQNYIDPQDRITQKATACSYATARSCASGTGTIAWNGCSVGAATMTGGWTETWPSNAACTVSFLGNNNVVERSSTGSTLNLPLGASITVDTSGGTAYDGTVFTAGSVITNRKKTSRKGASVFDYYVVPAITVSGALKNSSSNGLTGNRTMSGSVTIYHNLAKYTATNAFAAVTWGDSTCCYPTSGTITSSFSGTGAPATSGVMTFTSTCGEATFIATTGSTAGATESVTLDSCQ